MRCLNLLNVSIALLAVWSCPIPFLQAQQPSGSIYGHVTCNDGNFPARRAKVQLIPLDQMGMKTTSTKGSQGSAVETTTDLFGFYQIYSVTAGSYLINATLDGYADDLKLMRAVLDRYSPKEQETLIASFPQAIVKPGSTASQDVVLRRAAAISGRLTVDLGGTVSKALITATLVSGPLIGSPVNDDKSPVFSTTSFTDDRGVYRVSGLPPGDYRLSVRLSSNFFSAKVTGINQVTLVPQRAGLAELTVFAPEALEQADAKLVKVDDGDEITGIDLSVPLRMLHSIGGMITEGGRPVATAFVDIQRQGHPASEVEAISLPDGTYRFDLLPPGNYTISAKLPDSAQGKARTLSGQVTSILDANDALDANIELRPAKAP